jgi:hypothetical protein
MYLRSILAVLTVTIILAAAGCEANPSLNSITVTPSTAALSAVGQTFQLTATGTYVHGSHPSTTQNITDDSQWASSVPSVATVSSTGVVTAVATGTTTITASKTGSTGVFSGTATVTVSPNGLVSIAIIPPATTTPPPALGHAGETTQFVAIGTFSGTPTTLDLTNQVTWLSSDVSVATIDSAGLATAGLVSGATTITAIYPVTPTAGVATITGSSELQVQIGGTGGQLPSLAVFSVGQGTGTVTSNPPGINCTPTTTGSGCTGYFPLNQLVTLTAAPGANSQPGGWSSNCATIPPNSPTATTCTITLSLNAAGELANESVGVIFNTPPNP